MALEVAFDSAAAAAHCRRKLQVKYKWRYDIGSVKSQTRLGPSLTTTVHLQITKANFQQSLPIIKQALQECHFFAFDCEMTGLDTAETRQEYLDEIEDRYQLVSFNLHKRAATCLTYKARSMQPLHLLLVLKLEPNVTPADGNRWHSLCADTSWPISIRLVRDRASVQASYLQFLRISIASKWL